MGGFNIGKFFKDYGPLILGGVSTLGGVLGNRAEGAGITASREDLQKGKDEAMAYALEAMKGSKPVLDWGYQQGRGNQDWAVQNALKNKTSGLNAAYGSRTSGLMNALSALQGGYNQGFAQMSPWSQAGQGGLSAMQKMVGNPGTAATGRGTTQFQMPQFNIPGNQSGSFGFSAMPGQGGASGLPQVSMPTGAPGSGGGSSLSDLYKQMASQKVQGPGLGSTLGGIGGSVAGGLIGSGAGPLPSLGLGALGGPIGMAVGALVGPLVGHFTRRGREKEAASGVANDLGTWIEDTFKQYKSGSIDAATFEAAIKSGKQEYDKWVDSNLKDDFVKSNSKTNQAYWINQSMKEKGLNFTVA